MARIPYPDPPQEFTELRVQLNLFRMLAHAGTTGKRVLSLGSALLNQQEQQVLHFTQDVYWDRTISDEDFAGMTQVFTSREMVELLHSPST
jgi:alkylhydroperoxidase family enzyme